MKTLIKALLAASMLVPAAAQAQDAGEHRGGRGEWHQREGGARGDRVAPQRSGEVGVEAQIRTERPQRGDFRADRGPQQPQPQPQVRQDDSRAQQDRRAEFRRDETRTPGFDPQQRRPSFQARQEGGADWRRDDRADERRNDGRAGQSYRQFGDAQDGGARRGDRWQGNDGRGNGWQANTGRGFGDGRSFSDGRGFAGRSYENRSGWNRGWRNDDRYDWSRYRAVNRSAYRLPRYYAPSGWGYGYRRFSVGVSLSSILFSQNYWIDDPFAYRLPEAYGPYRWVRYYDDALLVDIRTGQVIDTVYDIFD